jgi:phage terminase large subunit GpA-like protein
MTQPSPFKWFKTSPEIIRLAVMLYVRFPLSLRNVEDLLHERGIDVSHEAIRYWWHRFEWQKTRERNEALDCRVYARAAAWIAGADRWPEATWADLEAQLGVPSGMDSPAGLIGRPDVGTQGKRRSDWLGRREGWF